MFLLDTAAVSEFSRDLPNRGFDDWFATVDWLDLHISAITAAELWEGILALPNGKKRRELEAWFDMLLERFEGRILAVDLPVALQYAEMQRKRGPLPVLDTLIAATATTHRLTVVTRNTSDLGRTGARVFDPWD